MGIISLAELQALSPQTPLLVRRLPRGPRKSAVLSREVKMLAFATAALLVLATTAQAATEYNYGGRSSYEHGVYGSEYKPHEPRSAYKRYKNFCYVSGLCKDARRSALHPDFMWSTDACCGN